MVGESLGNDDVPSVKEEETSVHLLTAVAIQSVDFSVQSLFIPDSSGAVIKASLEMHAQKTSPS